MNEPRLEGRGPEDEPRNLNNGPNLTLIYTLIVLAMVAAIAIAALVVLPFYKHR